MRGSEDDRSKKDRCERATRLVGSGLLSHVDSLEEVLLHRLPTGYEVEAGCELLYLCCTLFRLIYQKITIT